MQRASGDQRLLQPCGRRMPVHDTRALPEELAESGETSRHAVRDRHLSRSTMPRYSFQCLLGALPAFNQHRRPPARCRLIILIQSIFLHIHPHFVSSVCLSNSAIFLQLPHGLIPLRSANFAPSTRTSSGSPLLRIKTAHSAPKLGRWGCNVPIKMCSLAGG